MSAEDWGKGLPMGMLALISGGKDDLKVMREVCKSWQDGFEGSVSKMRVKTAGPLLPANGNLASRMHQLTSLDLGACCMDENDLQRLAGLKKLATLVLAEPEDYFCSLYDEGNTDKTPLGTCLTGAGLRHLQGLPISSINLHSCKNLNEAALALLRGLPLMHLDLGYTGISDAGLQYLEDLPLEKLNVGGCKVTDAGLGIIKRMHLTDLGLDNIKRLTGECLAHLRGPAGARLKSLDLSFCGRHVTDASIAHLRGLPLTWLKLAGCGSLTDAAVECLRGMPLRNLVLLRCSRMTDTAVSYLAGMRLEKLILSFWHHLTDAGLAHLRGMPLRKLDLYGCQNITGSGFSNFQGMPLAFLDLSYCIRLRDEGLEHLRGLPLSTLILDHCNGLTAAALDILDWMPKGKYMDGCNWRPGCTPTLSNPMDGPDMVAIISGAHEGPLPDYMAGMEQYLENAGL